MPERRQRVFSRLLVGIRTEVTMHDTAPANIDSVIVERLRATLASFKDKKSYYSKEGREHLHVILQALAEFRAR